MSSGADRDWVEILNLFKLPDRSVYILGCFARHVTVYSQQVRALNLVAALRHTGKLPAGTKVAVIGGGAAGLMAGAACAFCGASVTVLDELSGPMALQRNNRQRWIHPFIYDWPSPEKTGADALLPLLSWQAGYANDVAEQIEKQWKRLMSEPKRYALKGTITAYWNVTNVNVLHNERHPVVSWTSEGYNPNRRVAYDVAIMAVGFGLEPENNVWQSSYWTEDSLDGDFRRQSNPTWLVSGIGDGGLTDVMRLCIRRFRHHEVEELFSSIDGIGVLKSRLNEVHPPNGDPISAEWVHDKFLEVLGLSENAPPRWPGLEKVFTEEVGRLRKGPKILLASDSPWLYGPGSSLLNRLIISQLEQLGRIALVHGRVEKVVQKQNKLVVHLSGKRTETADRVLLRHGPKRALERFPEIWADSQFLKKTWAMKGINRDPTRTRLWDPGEFGEEDIATVATEASLVSGLFVKAEKLSVIKELRDDGSSYISYEIQGLSILGDTIRGIQFVLRSTIGCVGLPELNEDAKRLGMRWEDPEGEDRGMPVKSMTDWLRHVTRILYIPRHLQKRSLNFGFTLTLLNADALTSWELEQMYKPAQREHVNGEKLVNTEFLARYVWFPIDELTIRMTLPARISSAPFVDVFTCSQNVKHTDWHRDGLLQFSPPIQSQLHPSKIKWPASPEARARDAKYLTNVSPRTWELHVPKPAVGSCYSLNWELPNQPLDHLTEPLVREAKTFRARLLKHGENRRRKKKGDPLIRAEFLKLSKALRAAFGSTVKGEQFEVSLMVYDERLRELKSVESVLSDKDAMQNQLDWFDLPFGSGLAGAALREADKIFLYHGPCLRPSFYLPIDDSRSHEAMLAIPLDHPGLAELPEEYDVAGFERSRQCLGVINVASDVTENRLRPGKVNARELAELTQLCRNFITAILFPDRAARRLAFKSAEGPVSWTPRSLDTSSAPLPAIQRGESESHLVIGKTETDSVSTPQGVEAKPIRR